MFFPSISIVLNLKIKNICKHARIVLISILCELVVLCLDLCFFSGLVVLLALQ
jgi:hypothetical protein